MQPLRVLRQLPPILAALSRHKIATVLIVAQIALTLAVAANALFIAATRMVHLQRPTGTDEAHLLVVRVNWRNGLSPAQVDGYLRGDVQALRQLPGVVDAFASQAYPLEGGSGFLIGLKRAANQPGRPQFSTGYIADEHAINTFGLHLIAGRNFRSDEIGSLGPYAPLAPAQIIISADLAHKLYADGSALGRTVYLTDGPSQVIGIVQHLQGAFAGSTTRSIDEDSVLVPARYDNPDESVFILRSASTDMRPLTRAALAALSAQGAAHVIDPEQGVLSLAQIRQSAYATDRSVALLMTAISMLMLLCTAAGIVGLSSFWVSQRRRQIGIRRALGASHGDILGHFHLENFLIVSAGIVLGAVLAIVTNLVLMKLYELPAMPAQVLLWGALLLWLLGQLAVIVPARGAARIAPVAAIRAD